MMNSCEDKIVERSSTISAIFNIVVVVAVVFFMVIVAFCSSTHLFDYIVSVMLMICGIIALRLTIPYFFKLLKTGERSVTINEDGLRITCGQMTKAISWNNVHEVGIIHGPQAKGVYYYCVYLSVSTLPNATVINAPSWFEIEQWPAGYIAFSLPTYQKLVKMCQAYLPDYAAIFTLALDYKMVVNYFRATCNAWRCAYMCNDGKIYYITEDEYNAKRVIKKWPGEKESSIILGTIFAFMLGLMIIMLT